jgi:hypothetical protein
MNSKKYMLYDIDKECLKCALNGPQYGESRDLPEADESRVFLF